MTGLSAKRRGPKRTVRPSRILLLVFTMTVMLLGPIGEQVALAQADQAPTEVERQRWRAFADAAAAVGPDDGALLMSALIGGYVPRRR